MFGQARQQALIGRPYRRFPADQRGTTPLGGATSEFVAYHGHCTERRTTKPAVSPHAVPESRLFMAPSGACRTGGEEWLFFAFASLKGRLVRPRKDSTQPPATHRLVCVPLMKKSTERVFYVWPSSLYDLVGIPLKTRQHFGIEPVRHAYSFPIHVSPRGRSSL